MKLFYSPGSCAMSPHIVLSEAGATYTLERVDLATKTTESGQPLSAINPQDAVPVLLLGEGETLTEGAAIVQYVADRHPEAGLLPPAGTLARAKVQQWLNYIATEMHKAHVPLFKADYPQVSKDLAIASVKRAYDFVAAALADRPYLTGETFTVADAYLFTIVNWHNFIGLDLAPWPVLVAYQERIAARPAVRKAMAEEGLIAA
ncbi:glutathione transferase GstA [Erythrobacter sp. NE805]|uniref:glutathione transferase GstA n=1 Tax=Erythrobacter sp. NE805 TaxID=3389875 RepID=UPI00396B17CC